jgi:hypothetical protein
MLQKSLILISSLLLCGFLGCGYEGVGMRKGLVAAVGEQRVPIKKQQDPIIDRLFIGPFKSTVDIPEIYWEMPNGKMVYLPDMKDDKSIRELPNLKKNEYSFPSLFPKSCELDDVMDQIQISDAYYYYYCRLPDDSEKIFCWADAFGFCLNKETNKTIAIYVGEKTHLWNKDKTKRYEFPFPKEDFVELFGEPETISTYRETIWTALQSQRGAKEFIKTTKELEEQDKAQQEE